jgi:peroxiredoxin family protein
MADVAEPFGVLLASGTYLRAHHALVLATAAAAMGRPVVLFATNHGTRALARDWCGLEGAAEDAAVQARGVAGFETLREAAAELGVRCIACEAGLRIAALPAAALAQGVTVAGVATFLEAVRGGQMVAL